MLIIFAVSPNFCNFAVAMYNKKIPIDINCGFRIAIEVMGGKWKPYIIFYIESAATSTEEIGNSVYPPARRKLAEHGIGCQGKTARQMTRSDYDRYDLLVGMDSWNIRNMNRICGGDPDGKIVMLMDYTDRPGDVADPWYTGDFKATWRDVLEGCRGLLDAIVK